MPAVSAAHPPCRTRARWCDPRGASQLLHVRSRRQQCAHAFLVRSCDDTLGPCDSARKHRASRLGRSGWRLARCRTRVCARRPCLAALRRPLSHRHAEIRCRHRGRDQRCRHVTAPRRAGDCDPAH